MSTILVIDDDHQVCAMLRQALEQVGYEVLEAKDGKAGMRSYHDHPVDLVITDILMPEKEGLTCILELRRLDPDVPVIAISGGTDSIDVLEMARRFGACRTIWKPFDVADVVEGVREELQRRGAA